jgi:hypothetical protein
MMPKITPVLPGYLYAIDQVFPKELFDSIQSIDWQTRPANRLEIGQGLRRQIVYDPAQDHVVNDYCFNQLQQAIEQQCPIRFTHKEQQSLQYWLDEPGFRPDMHTDGDLSSAVQIYLQAGTRLDLGTAFYHTEDYRDQLHLFASEPNTGYIMFNQPEPGRPMLWHDMTQPIPEGIDRLCLYITMGAYLRV